MTWGDPNQGSGFGRFRTPAPPPPAREPFPTIPPALGIAVVVLVVFAVASATSRPVAWALLAVMLASWWAIARWRHAHRTGTAAPARGRPRSWVELVDTSADPIATAQATAQGHGNFAGITETGGAAFAQPEHGTLVIGPPRSGKTSGLVVPMLLLHNGPAVVTSTKDEVARITAMARHRRGRVFLFDLAGEADGRRLPPQIEPLRWSPLQSAAGGWLDAVKMARAMTEASVRRAGVEDASYWSQRASQLLAALLYAASRPQLATGLPADMGDVVAWVATGDLDMAEEVLAHVGAYDEDARRAARQLESILAAPDKERGSIVSTTYSTIEAYNSAGALAMSTNPTFDAAAFAASDGDTIYVTATSEDQAALAPLVVGLLQDVRRATFARARSRGVDRDGSFTLLLLDEVANIAPIPDLPELASEAGGQGLRLACILQNLPQAAARWGKEKAYGMLSTFGQVVIFGALRDPETLQTLSTLLGTEIRYTPSVGFSSGGPGAASTTTSWSQQTFPTATPSEISQIPAGWLLVFEGAGYRFLHLASYYRYAPWPRLLTQVYTEGWTKTLTQHDRQVLDGTAPRGRR